MSEGPQFNPDLLDLLDALSETLAEHLLVGAHAMAVHGVSRATGDVDLLIRAEPENAARVLRALQIFGAPLDAHGVTLDDLCREGTVYQMGLPPRRIDILTSITGVSFEQAWRGRASATLAGRAVCVLGLEELKRNKRATGRPRDLLDLELLEALERQTD
jgi:hypothetical protein